jgi:hypothetical protein
MRRFVLLVMVVVLPDLRPTPVRGPTRNTAKSRPAPTGSV